jgi:hypothetical protein
MTELRKIPIVAAAVVLLMAVPATAADSFNGWWRLDEPASTGVPTMMHGHETVVHLTQAGDRFTIDFLFDGQAMNSSEFILDGKTHPGQLGATQEARWVHQPSEIQIDIHRPQGEPMPGGNEHLIWQLQPDGREIRRTSTDPDSKSPPQIYVYRRLPGPPHGR